MHQYIVDQPQRFGQRHPCHNEHERGAKLPSRSPPDLPARFNITPLRTLHICPRFRFSFRMDRLLLS